MVNLLEYQAIQFDLDNGVLAMTVTSQLVPRLLGKVYIIKREI